MKKYFKVTNLNDSEDEFYVSSTLPNETPTHLAMALHLGEGDGRYDIKEVTAEEFYSETTEDEDDTPLGCSLGWEEDYCWEDNDDEYWD